MLSASPGPPSRAPGPDPDFPLESPFPLGKTLLLPLPADLPTQPLATSRKVSLPQISASLPPCVSGLGRLSSELNPEGILTVSHRSTDPSAPTMVFLSLRENSLTHSSAFGITRRQGVEHVREVPVGLRNAPFCFQELAPPACPRHVMFPGVPCCCCSHSTATRSPGRTPCSRPALPVAPCQSVTSCCPTFPAPPPHDHSSPVRYLDIYCFSPSTDLQWVPINNFKRSPVFFKLRAIMEI